MPFSHAASMKLSKHFHPLFLVQSSTEVCVLHEHELSFSPVFRTPATNTNNAFFTFGANVAAYKSSRAFTSRFDVSNHGPTSYDCCTYFVAVDQTILSWSDSSHRSLSPPSMCQNSNILKILSCCPTSGHFNLRDPWPSRRGAPPGRLTVEFVNVGGWLTFGDLAMDSCAQFLAVAEHRLIPARARSLGHLLRKAGHHSVWALPVRIKLLVAMLVSLVGAPLALPTFAASEFLELFG